MKLIIHDLDKDEWKRREETYSGWEVISDSGTIQPCVGCFGCWVKTPGVCVIKDGYEGMGALIHRADEVVVISRYTYGGFSSFVKNVFDRSIGYILPFVTICHGEMHHKKRYRETKTFSFIFRGHNLSEEEKELAKRYVTAVCKNFYGVIKDLSFEECDEQEKVEDNVVSDNMNAEIADKANVQAADNGDMHQNDNKVLLLNCSLRGESAHTKNLLKRLEKHIHDDAEIMDIVSYTDRTDELISVISSYKRVVLGMPLYVDGIPSAALRLMEKMESVSKVEDKHIYVVANMGFYESHQIVNLLSMVKAWSEKCGFSYCGGIAVGAGIVLGQYIRLPDPTNSPAKNVELGLRVLAKAINSSVVTYDIYADAYKFPRFKYQYAGNSGWLRSAKKNGLKKKDLLKR